MSLQQIMKNSIHSTFKETLYTPRTASKGFLNIMHVYMDLDIVMYKCIYTYIFQSFTRKNISQYERFGCSDGMKASNLWKDINKTWNF